MPIKLNFIYCIVLYCLLGSFSTNTQVTKIQYLYIVVQFLKNTFVCTLNNFVYNNIKKRVLLEGRPPANAYSVLEQCQRSSDSPVLMLPGLYSISTQILWSWFWDSFEVCCPDRHIDALFLVDVVIGHRTLSSSSWRLRFNAIGLPPSFMEDIEKCYPF